MVDPDAFWHLRYQIVGRPMTYDEWYKKRVMTRAEYELLKADGQLDPMGVYVITED